MLKTTILKAKIKYELKVKTMNDSIRNHLISGFDTEIRNDGRKLMEYRQITIEYGVSKTAEGSAKVKIGDTEVIAGVKLSVEAPYPDTPDVGSLMIGVELLPISNENYEPGPPSIDSIELARVTDRGIRESGAIDVKKLCIKEGEKVWVVSVDICTINDDGNLFDAVSLAAIAALKDAKFPKYDEEKEMVDYTEKTDESVPLTNIPIGVTVIKIGEHFIVDPNKEEESLIDARLTVTMDENNVISAMQKGGESPISEEDVSKMIDIAMEKSKELRKYLGEAK